MHTPSKKTNATIDGKGGSSGYWKIGEQFCDVLKEMLALREKVETIKCQKVVPRAAVWFFQQLKIIPFSKQFGISRFFVIVYLVIYLKEGHLFKQI